nr:hypothetical protein [Endozoicomonas sp.]
METSISTAVQITPVGECSDRSEPILCRFGCFSVSKRAAVYYAVSLPVSFTVGLPVLYAMGFVTGGFVTGFVAGVVTGGVTGVVTGRVAENYYVRHRHVIPIDTSIIPTKITCDETTPLLSD